MNDDTQIILAIGFALFLFCIGIGSCCKMDNGEHFKQPILSGETK